MTTPQAHVPLRGRHRRPTTVLILATSFATAILPVVLVGVFFGGFAGMVAAGSEVHGTPSGFPRSHGGQGGTMVVGETVIQRVPHGGGRPPQRAVVPNPAFFVRPPIEVPDHLDRRMVAERHWAPPDGS